MITELQRVEAPVRASHIVNDARERPEVAARLTNVSLRYGKTVALDAVNLEVPAGCMPQFALLMILVLLPLQMLSGGMTPRESMPEFVQQIMMGAPTTHFVKLAQGILFRGGAFDVVWPQFLALALISALLFGVALARFRRTIGSMA